MTCRCDFCCCPHQTYLQIFHNKGISRRLLNIHSLPATLSSGKRWKEMSLLDEYRNSQGHSGTQQQNSAKQPLPMPAKPRSRWGFRWPWIESIGFGNCPTVTWSFIVKHKARANTQHATVPAAVVELNYYWLAATVCALRQRRLAELFLLWFIKWTVKLVLKWIWSLSRQYVDGVRVLRF